MEPLDRRQVEAAVAAGALLLDLRRPIDFVTEHPRGAIFMPFHRTNLPTRAKQVLMSGQAVVLLMEPEMLAPMAARLLSDAGFKVRGWLEGGLAAWKAAGGACDAIPVVQPESALELINTVKPTVLDVREVHEYDCGHVPHAVNRPWWQVWSQWEDLPRENLLLMCGTQQRSVMAASFLRLRGFEDLKILWGGMTAWTAGGYPQHRPLLV